MDTCLATTPRRLTLLLGLAALALLVPIASLAAQEPAAPAAPPPEIPAWWTQPPAGTGTVLITQDRDIYIWTDDPKQSPTCWTLPCPESTIYSVVRPPWHRGMLLLLTDRGSSDFASYILWLDPQSGTFHQVFSSYRDQWGGRRHLLEEAVTRREGRKLERIVDNDLVDLWIDAEGRICFSTEDRIAYSAHLAQGEVDRLEVLDNPARPASAGVIRPIEVGRKSCWAVDWTGAASKQGRAAIEGLVQNHYSHPAPAGATRNTEALPACETLVTVTRAGHVDVTHPESAADGKRIQLPQDHLSVEGVIAAPGETGVVVLMVDYGQWDYASRLFWVDVLGGTVEPMFDSRRDMPGERQLAEAVKRAGRGSACAVDNDVTCHHFGPDGQLYILTEDRLVFRARLEGHKVVGLEVVPDAPLEAADARPAPEGRGDAKNWVVRWMKR